MSDQTPAARPVVMFQGGGARKPAITKPLRTQAAWKKQLFAWSKTPRAGVPAPARAEQG